jgi:DNA-binding beta-propeller fold protein YncE
MYCLVGSLPPHSDSKGGRDGPPATGTEHANGHGGSTMTMTRRATATGPYNKNVCLEDGQFMTPTGVATDGSGNVYVADTNNNRIQKFACP